MKVLREREDSFNNAMTFLSADVIGSDLGKALQKIKNSNDREKTLNTLTSYFEGNVWHLLEEL